MITPAKEDLRLIRRALKSWRRFTREHRYGGLWAKWDECKQAIEALKRVGGRVANSADEITGVNPGE